MLNYREIAEKQISALNIGDVLIFADSSFRFKRISEDVIRFNTAHAGSSNSNIGTIELLELLLQAGYWDRGLEKNSAFEVYSADEDTFYWV
jgi:hypothetical protein